MKTREIVLPGEMLEERKGRKLGSGVYLEDDKVFSKEFQRVAVKDARFHSLNSLVKPIPFHISFKK